MAAPKGKSGRFLVSGRFKGLGHLSAEKNHDSKQKSNDSDLSETDGCCQRVVWA